ncbi:MAG: class A beta-lactamase-related serine hydrolase [Megasphaera sp.]|jgi:beta-lactamase class A|nr:class A beta-lactamase-related serine hydrolase [Megasphaera sp.]MCH4218531.1 class A beta-lactamase-related serine hydrolase [Megasphaera sp.]
MEITKQWMKQRIDQRMTENVDVSVYVRALTSNAPFIYNDRLMQAASLIKLPIMITAFLQEWRGHLHFADTYPVRDAVEGGSFYEASAGKVASVYELVFHMIVESDNTCANMLMDILGAEAINETAQMLSLEHTVLRRKMMDFAAASQGRENTTSVSEMGRLFGMLASGQCLDERRDEAMLLILSQQEDNCILPAQIPNNIRVEHKTGELEGVYHDCGIVRKPGNPYICCIMADGITNEPHALYDLSYLARDIYEMM